MIVVEEPGFMTTVQDAGRPGHYRRGIPPSGAMDMESYTLANALVDNRPGSAVLEFTFMGPRLTFSAPATVAITGGEIPILLNGNPVEPWRSHHVQPGEVLSFGFLQTGVRGYIAVAGGFDVTEFLGSRSTHVNSGFGGFDGRKLHAGDILHLLPPEHASFHAVRKLSAEHVPHRAKDVTLRYVPGLFDYRLTEEGRRDFEEREWAVTPNADRTGIRLSCKNSSALEFVHREQPFGAGSDPSNVVDAGYPIGAIQIPSGTEPIVLARDAVTAGGYCTVGTVITADLDVLGQAPTHGRVRFHAVSLEEAMSARHERRDRIARACESLSS